MIIFNKKTFTETAFLRIFLMNIDLKITLFGAGAKTNPTLLFGTVNYIVKYFGFLDGFYRSFE